MTYAGLHIVWEGLVAVPSKKYNARKFDLYLTLNMRRSAIELYRANPVAVERLWELARAGVGVSLVSFLPFGLHLVTAERLDREGIPRVRFITTTPYELARDCGRLPGISQVVDPDPDHAYLYGAKGRTLRPEDAHLIGQNP